MIPLALRRSATIAMAMVCVLAALGVAGPVQAQDESVHTELVVGGGVSFASGSADTGTGMGLAGHAGLRHQRQSLVFSVRAGTNYSGPAPTPSLAHHPWDRFDEIALMAGYAVRSGDLQAVLSTGVAAVSGERAWTAPAPDSGTTNARFKTRVGIPLQLAFSALGGSRLGLTAHANLNPEKVFWAVTATYVIDDFGRRR